MTWGYDLLIKRIFFIILLGSGILFGQNSVNITESIAAARLTVQKLVIILEHHPLSCSDLPESGLYRKVIKDCELLLSEMDTRNREDLPDLEHQLTVIFNQIENLSMTVTGNLKKENNIQKNYFSGGI